MRRWRADVTVVSTTGKNITGPAWEKGVKEGVGEIRYKRDSRVINNRREILL